MSEAFISKNCKILKPYYTTLQREDINMNLNEERDMLRDLPKGKTNPRSIPVNSCRHHAYMESDVYNKRCTENLVSIQSFHRHVSRFKEYLYKYDNDDDE
jgi:hypothetical protein